MLISEVSLERVLVLEHFITETTVDLTPSQVNIHHVGLGVVSCPYLKYFPHSWHWLLLTPVSPELCLQVSEATATGFVNS